jgi:hypothetical protein
METLVLKVGYREEEADTYPEATPVECLNSTAVMLLMDCVADAKDIYWIHFTIDNEASTITFRSAKPELLTRFRHVLSGIPELIIVSATI